MWNLHPELGSRCFESFVDQYLLELFSSKLLMDFLETLFWIVLLFSVSSFEVSESRKIKCEAKRKELKD